MFTIFELVRLLTMLAGAIVAAVIGANNFGIVGGVAGALMGFVGGGVLGYLPLVAALKLLARRITQQTNEQLLFELHQETCLTPNLILLELKRRGYDIRREIPRLHSLLASPQMDRRTKGWAALTSAYPELMDTISGYNPTAQTKECQAMCKPLLEATTQGEE